MRKILILLLTANLMFCQTAHSVSWQKEWSSVDDQVTEFGGADVEDIQDDVDGQVPTLTGNNTFTGTNTFSGTVTGISSEIKHYRKGLTLKAGTTADTDIVVRPGTIDIAKTNITSTADSSALDVSAESFLAGSNGTSQWIYIYVFDNSSVLGFKLSTEAPDLSDASGNTTELPFRYQLYSSVYYRCVGAVFQDAAGDLCFGHASSEGLYVSNFDASGAMVIGGLGTGSDQTFSTIWTPKFVKVIYGSADTTPANGEVYLEFNVTQLMLDTNWYGTQLNVQHKSAPNEHQWIAITNPGSVNAVTAQVAGTAGSFTVDAMTDNKLFYAIAFSNDE